MTAYSYKKAKAIHISKTALVRVFSLGLMLGGIGIIAYIAAPLILWQVYFAPELAMQNIASPIPKTTIINALTFNTLQKLATDAIVGTNYTDAKNWFPEFPTSDAASGLTPSYFLSIPKIGVKDAIVSTSDYDLSLHLVNYGGTAIPPEKGNAVIFGHSTLPQLFNPKDYKTIFAHAYKLIIGDSIITTINNVSYRYVIQRITVVDPTDTSAFSQDVDSQYLTLVTCTPPGTTWKRLILKAKLEQI